MTSSMMKLVMLLVAALFQGANAMNLFNGFDDGIFPLFPTVAQIPLICGNSVVDAPWWVCSESPPETGTGFETEETGTTEGGRDASLDSDDSPAKKKGGDKRTRKLQEEMTPTDAEKPTRRRRRKLRGE